MSNHFVISDLHFGHKNICRFLREDGTKLREWDDVDEMNEVLIDNWNKIVKPNDKVYNLGDVTLNRRHLHLVNRLNGKQRLIKGNHDIFNLEDYTPYFYDVSACKEFKQVILTHIPIHESQLRRFKVNVHGHLHDQKINDPRYINVCVENTNYMPVSMDEIFDRVAKL